jgi:DNA-binding NarL/FixJ family response regulator
MREGGGADVMGEMRGIRVLVVDDHQVFADAMRLVLGRRPEIGGVESVPNAEDALARCSLDPPDVVLMDLHLPGMDGLEATRRLTAAAPTVHVVMITADEDSDAVRRASLEAGASAVVGKTVGADEVIDVLRHASHGRRAARANGAGAARGPVKLTRREKQILLAIADGRSTRELAKTLGISPLTVETHLKSIYGKLGVHSRVEAITFAWREGLIPGTRTA